MEKEEAIMANSVVVVETVVTTIAKTAVENEQYFCELDSAVGDGDFGFSLARGFEKVLEELPQLDRTDAGTFLKKVALIITSRCGGTSGPIWGTGFLRAATALNGKTVLESSDAVLALRAAFKGIQDRGGAALGDKTLLDALGPLTDAIEAELAKGSNLLVALDAAVAVADTAARETAKLIAKRGRASYTGERSIGSPDAGAMALALISKRVNEACRDIAAA
jgi:dihydroxyacetone kinase phosphoprotein-dependent L subunit